MRSSEERFFDTSDGTRLFYRHWAPVTAETAPDRAPERAIVLLHRGHEHSGRLAHVVDEIDLPEFSFFAWDARGHGHSGNSANTVVTLATFVRDLDEFVRHVSSAHGIAVENIAVIAQSVGSVLAATWAHDYAPRIRAMVLASPAFKVKLYVPFARPVLGFMNKFITNMTVKSYVKARALTHDPERIASFESDPLIQRPISVRVLVGLYSTADRVIADAQAIHTPTQLLMSGKDWVVHHKPQHQFFERLGSTVKEKHVFEGFYHDTLGEKDRALPIGKARDFLLRMFAAPYVRDSLLNAHESGYTKDEFDRLSRKLFPLSFKAIHFGFSRFSMKTGGRLSDGVRLGLKTGFDSGSTLDYVYRNRASGITPAGKLVDWFYINSIGWRGIRVRKQNLESLLAKAMGKLRESGRAVRILDIAAGHGRYVIEAIGKLEGPPDAVLLRDYSDLNVAQGQALIRSKNMDAVVRFEKGDAFDADSLAAIQPHPTLGIVSGLYELFPDNALIRKSLAGLADAIEPGGFLVYTGQPWHPQLEMIARVLSSHRNGKPWIMRRRTQDEMDQLVESAGFRKMEQLTDDWGIFTVSLAQRLNQDGAAQMC